MSSQKYILLAEVTLLHNYFEDGIFRDIRVIPDKVTQTFMWNCGLLFRLTDVGFSIFYTKPFDLDYLKDITNFFNDQLLRFELFGESQDFLNYTDAPLGQLVVYKYNNRKIKESEVAHFMLPKIEQRIMSKGPLGQIDLYLSEFLSSEEIVSKEYVIMFSARSTRWKYYVMNVVETIADRLVISAPTGEEFVGPVKKELQNGQPAFEFSSGKKVFPFEEKPTSYCSLRKKSLVAHGEVGGEEENEIVMENLPVPSPHAITTIENDDDSQVACSSVYIYL